MQPFKPTIGRVVLFHPQQGVTRAAIIAHVHSDTMLNLAFFDSNGIAHNQTSVTLVQPGEKAPEVAAWCEPVPHQERQPVKQELNLTLTMGPDVAAALKRIIVLVDQQMALELAGKQ